MPHAPVNGIELYYEVHGDERSDGRRPLVLLHGGLMTIDLNWRSMLDSLAAGRQVIAVELQGHGHTADPDDRPMSIATFGADVVALLDHLGIARADVHGFSLGALVTYELALTHPDRIGKVVIGSADGRRPPGRESVPLTPDDPRMPTEADFQAWHAAYLAVAPDPDRFPAFAERVTAMVHAHPGWTDDELRSLAAPTLLVFGDQDFNPLPDVLELLGVLPNAQLAVLPGCTHAGVLQRSEQLLALVVPFLDAG